MNNILEEYYFHIFGALEIIGFLVVYFYYRGTKPVEKNEYVEAQATVFFIALLWPVALTLTAMVLLGLLMVQVGKFIIGVLTAFTNLIFKGV